MTDADTFRIGNIGHLFGSDMEHLVECIKTVLIQMEVGIPVEYWISLPSFFSENHHECIQGTATKKKTLCLAWRGEQIISIIIEP